MSTFEKIYEVVRNIPKGKIATYGQVAELVRRSLMNATDVCRTLSVMFAKTATSMAF